MSFSKTEQDLLREIQGRFDAEPNPDEAEDERPQWTTARIKIEDSGLKSILSSLKKIKSVISKVKSLLSALRRFASLLKILETLLTDPIQAIIKQITRKLEKTLRELGSTGLYYLDTLDYTKINTPFHIQEDRPKDSVVGERLASNESEASPAMTSVSIFEFYKAIEATFSEGYSEISIEDVQALNRGTILEDALVSNFFTKVFFGDHRPITYDEWISTIAEAFIDPLDFPSGSVMADYSRVVEGEGFGGGIGANFNASDTDKLLSSLSPKNLMVKSGRPFISEGTQSTIVIIGIAFPNFRVFISTLKIIGAMFKSFGNNITVFSEDVINTVKNLYDKALYESNEIMLKDARQDVAESDRFRARKEEKQRQLNRQKRERKKIMETNLAKQEERARLSKTDLEKIKEIDEEIELLSSSLEEVDFEINETEIETANLAERESEFVLKAESKFKKSEVLREERLRIADQKKAEESKTNSKANDNKKEPDPPSESSFDKNNPFKSLLDDPTRTAGLGIKTRAPGQIIDYKQKMENATNMIDGGQVPDFYSINVRQLLLPLFQTLESILGNATSFFAPQITLGDILDIQLAGIEKRLRKLEALIDQIEQLIRLLAALLATNISVLKIKTNGDNYDIYEKILNSRGFPSENIEEPMYHVGFVFAAVIPSLNTRSFQDVQNINLNTYWKKQQQEYDTTAKGLVSKGSDEIANIGKILGI